MNSINVYSLEDHICFDGSMCGANPLSHFPIMFNELYSFFKNMKIKENQDQWMEGPQQ